MGIGQLLSRAGTELRIVIGVKGSQPSKRKDVGTACIADRANRRT
jgi:hypothetical protein